MAQDSVSPEPFAIDYLSGVSSRLDQLSGAVEKKSEKLLSSLKKSEERIYKKLLRKDSLKAKAFLLSSLEDYEHLKEKIGSKTASPAYLPYLDTLKTSLHFLRENSGLLSNLKGRDKKLEATLLKAKELEESLAKAENAKAFLRERRQVLKAQLANLPFTKELKKLNKQAYYYSAQLQQYKEVLKDPKKLERKAVELLTQSKAFREFMKKNSELASLFRIPEGGNVGGGVSLAGLQTRASLNQTLTERFGSGAEITQSLQQSVREAQGQLAALKSKVEGLGSGSFGNGSEGDLPDFKPNNQKTKSFLKRLQVGTNLQSQKARFMFPVTSDLGLSLGYKLNDKSIVGLGGSYKLGLGRGWNNIALSHQGIGLRSFIDYQLKGAFYISGGYEQNYRAAFQNVQALQEHSAWQSSGLIGVSKEYKVSKKLKGNMQLLWDFLSYQQIPKTQAILFRIGYSLK